MMATYISLRLYGFVFIDNFHYLGYFGEHICINSLCSEIRRTDKLEKSLNERKTWLIIHWAHIVSYALYFELSTRALHTFMPLFLHPLIFFLHRATLCTNHSISSLENIECEISWPYACSTNCIQKSP